MRNRLISFDKAVGYIRLSTELQNDTPMPMERQASRVREASSTHGWNLLEIYDDVQSARGPHSLVRRPGLQDALKRAAEERAILVVSDASRLFRNVGEGMKTFRKFRVPVFSIADDKILTLKELGEAFRKGAEVADKSREGTSAAGKKTINRKLDHLPAATKASALSRKKRSIQIDQQISDILEENELHGKLKNRDFADLLNRRGILSGWTQPWTEAGIRRARKRAEYLLAEKRDLEAILDAEEELNEPVEQPYRGDPNYGMF